MRCARRLVIRAVAATMALAIVVGLAGCGASAPPGPTGTVEPSPSLRDTAFDPPPPAPALRLTDQDGKPFDLAAFRGEPAIVYFGYTHCPDICPTTLADIRAGIRLAGTQVGVVFVTVDPERDTSSAMKQYVDMYRAGFVGLTGTAAEIAAAAAAWGVSYARLDEQGSAGYAMAHSTDAYLVDATGMLRNRIFFGAPAELIASLVKAALR